MSFEHAHVKWSGEVSLASLALVSKTPAYDHYLLHADGVLSLEEEWNTLLLPST